MAIAKHNKKIDKMAMVGFAANFCAVFSLIYIVALLLVANIFGSNRAAMASLAQPIANSACSAVAGEPLAAAIPAILFPVSADNPSESVIKISIDDGGWTPKEIDLSLSSARTVEISNKGVNPHSFVIDGLGIDSGEIAPGAAKTVFLQNLSGEAAIYPFYSNISGDDKEKFSGQITIL
ncbi:MAG: cupredoxin domain-containing protein [Candidatus Nealsonbacteria bacterium DGGOD1a]|jgi:hypothetical protein|nr:MAG: cupredoxin domain-containing protein [Candidatus Nealsonbacteria bacterium DGGOD1a]